MDCGDAIWSKHRHDMVWCKCGKVAVDGGTHYMKITFDKTPPEYVDILVNESGEKVGFVRCKAKKKPS